MLPELLVDWLEADWAAPSPLMFTSVTHIQYTEVEHWRTVFGLLWWYISKLSDLLHPPLPGGCEGRVHRKENRQTRCWTSKVQGSAEKDERWTLEGSTRPLNLRNVLGSKDYRWITVSVPFEMQNMVKQKAMRVLKQKRMWVLHRVNMF